jgi:hypothetical protein
MTDMNLVRKNRNNKFVLNKDFFDYDAWRGCKDIVEKNCVFLKELNHPNFV